MTSSDYTNEPERLMSAEEVASMLGVKTKTIYNWVYERRIPHVKPTRATVRFRYSELLRWIGACSVPESGNEDVA